MNYIVMCRVSGGVTGNREAPMKGVDGVIKRFASREEASAEAAKLNVRMNHERRKADFTYWAEEVP